MTEAERTLRRAISSLRYAQLKLADARAMSARRRDLSDFYRTYVREREQEVGACLDYLYGIQHRMELNK